MGITLDDAASAEIPGYVVPVELELLLEEIMERKHCSREAAILELRWIRRR